MEIMIERGRGVNDFWGRLPGPIVGAARLTADGESPARSGSCGCARCRSRRPARRSPPGTGSCRCFFSYPNNSHELFNSFATDRAFDVPVRGKVETYSLLFEPRVLAVVRTLGP